MTSSISNSMIRSRPSDLPWLILALLGLLALRLSFLYFSRTDLFFDEAQYWVWSQEPAFGYFSKPPMLAWLIGLTTGLCGSMSEFCIRMASPILHTGTAFLVYFTATELYGSRTGLWSGLVFATLPGISLSASLISTDVPLLFFWAASLLAFVKYLNTHNTFWAIMLGIALGLGLMSKYAMVYFVMSAGIFLALEKDVRWMLSDARIILIVVIAGALLAPNIYWNLQNGLVTFTHTAANAKWGGSLFHPAKALEFFGAQFGVFGPILFGALLIIALRDFKEPLRSRDRMLLAFSVPIIVLITFQGFLSRAHANWAAVSYVAGAILVTATMLREDAKFPFRLSFALHIVVLITIGTGMAFAGRILLPGDPFKRVLGWRDAAHAVREKLALADTQKFGAIITDDRLLTAEFIYYLRDQSVPVKAWRPDGIPHDHFQLTRPLDMSTAEPALLVTKHANAGHVTSLYQNSKALGSSWSKAGLNSSRTLYFHSLSGFKGKPK